MRRIPKLDAAATQARYKALVQKSKLGRGIHRSRSCLVLSILSARARSRTWVGLRRASRARGTSKMRVRCAVALGLCLYAAEPVLAAPEAPGPHALGLSRTL